MIDARTEVTAWIKANRTTQKRLAEDAGMTKGQLCRILKYRDRKPSNLTRSAIARVTGLPVAEREAWE